MSEYVRSNLIARQHGWGDTTTPPIGQSVGQAIGGVLQTLFGAKPTTPTVVPQTDNTMLYLGVAAVAGIGIWAFTRRKKK